MSASTALLDTEARRERADIPAGYAPVPAPPGFVRHSGGCFLHEQRPVVALRVLAEHLNSIRIAHGGLLATLADTACGVVIKRALGLPVPPATVSLNVDYLGAVREGDWLEAEVEVLKVGRRITNASCMIRVSRRPVVRASGVFMMVAPVVAEPAGGADNPTGIGNL